METSDDESSNSISFPPGNVISRYRLTDLHTTRPFYIILIPLPFCTLRFFQNFSILSEFNETFFHYSDSIISANPSCYFFMLGVSEISTHINEVALIKYNPGYDKTGIERLGNYFDEAVGFFATH